MALRWAYIDGGGTGSAGTVTSLLDSVYFYDTGSGTKRALISTDRITPGQTRTIYAANTDVELTDIATNTANITALSASVAGNETAHNALSASVTGDRAALTALSGAVDGTATGLDNRIVALENATGSAGVGGSTGSLQYNAGAAGSGDQELKWDSGPKELKVTGSISTDGFFVNVRTPASGASYTVDSQATMDYILNCDTSVNNAIVLPSISAAGLGRHLIIKDAMGSASINNIVVTAGSDIDGQSSLTIANNWAAVSLYANTTGWMVF